MDPNERANAFKVTLTDLLHGTGMGFVALATVLPLLFRRLGAGQVEIGLLNAVGVAGFVLGQPLGLAFLGRRRRGKRFFMRWVLGGWMGMHVLMCVVVSRFSVDDPATCRWLLLSLYGIVTFGDGMILPVWIDWQGRLFSKAGRGRAMGMIAGAWALGQGIGSLAAGTLQRSLPFPLDYAVLFALAACMFATSTNFVYRVREPESITNDTESFALADLLGFLRASLRGANFLSYMFARVLLGTGAAAWGFFAVYFQSAEGGGVEASTIIWLGALTALTQFAASNLLGRLGDRAGHKRAVTIGAVAQFAAILIAYLGQGWVACALCAAVMGISWSSVWVSHNNMLFETCPHGHRISHIALSNALLGPFILLVPPALGWLMKQWGTEAGFALCLVPTAAGIIWLMLMVKEPRAMASYGEQPRQDGEHDDTT